MREVPQLRAKREARPWLASIGLALFAASFLWWQMLPERVPSAATPGDVSRPDGVGVVIIDAGHGGQDSGNVNSGLLEKDVALDVARRLDRILQLKGVTTLLTRSGDNYVSLPGRAAIANREQNALFVSIHFDEARPRPAANGVQTYYAAKQIVAQPLLASWLPFLQPTPNATDNFESQSLAGFIQDSLVNHTHAVNRGTKAEQFYVIANVRHPAVLIEGGFLTNKDEAMRLTTEEYREQLAGAIAEGVMKFRDALRERQRTVAAQTDT